MRREPVDIRAAQSAGRELVRIALKNTAVAGVRALRARKLQGEQRRGHGRIEASARSLHAGVVAFGKQREHVAEVAAARVAEPAYVFDAGQRVVGVAAYSQLAGGHRRPEEGTRHLRFDEAAHSRRIEIDDPLQISHGPPQRRCAKAPGSGAISAAKNPSGP
jgi:hypothetical protein